jgi:copper chaperone NosL
MRTRAAIAAILCWTAAACGSGAPSPAAAQGGVPCSRCAMVVVDWKLAAQLVARGEEPRFFDDIGCLAAFLAAHPAVPGARAFVADHRSGEWVDADLAVYSRDEAIATPMGSHIVAHATEGAAASDPSLRSAVRLSASDVFRGRIGQ